MCGKFFFTFNLATCLIIDILNKIVAFYSFSEPWGLREYCLSKHKEFEAKGHRFLECSPVAPVAPVARSEDILDQQILDLRRSIYKDDEIILSMMKFNRKFFSHDSMPKMELNKYAMQNNIPPPIYKTRRANRLYFTAIDFMGKKYSSLIWGREKKIAEQNTALLCLHRLGKYTDEYLIAMGCLLEKLPSEDVYEAQLD